MFGRLIERFGMGKKSAKRQPRILRYEALEQRVLFSADIIPGLDSLTVDEQVLAEDATGNDQFVREVAPAMVEQTAAETPCELVIVNPNVADYEQLTADLQGSDKNRIIEVVVLEADRDGIEQVSEILADHSDLAAVHFITHGADGQINLGNSWLNDNSLKQNSEAVAGWGRALTEKGDFLFYGCNIAADSPGRTLLNDIARLTGADAAASDDLTGQAQFGGDWVLEYDNGNIETAAAIDSATQQNWNGVLATFTVNTTTDTVDANPGDGSATDASGNTSLRAAIMEANALGVANEIILNAGTYTLSLGPAGDDNGARGDLDVTGKLTISGAGADVTVIDANSLDRVFHLVGNAADLTLTDLTVQGGSTNDKGGGIWVQHGLARLTASRVIVTGNIAENGAGIFNDGIMTLTDVMITNNGNAATKEGGGIHHKEAATLNGVTISGNQAADGGGIHNDNAAGSLSLTNVTVSGNTATNRGGGMYTQKPVTIVNSTFTLNSAATGGGISHNGGTVDIKNTIVARNLATLNPDVDGVFNSQGNNLIGDMGTASGFSHGIKDDQAGIAIGPIDPLLDSLQDNGGFTQTHALLAGSPAIDAGASAGVPATDQRGVVRPADGDGDSIAAVDIGAFEATANIIVAVDTTSDAEDAPDASTIANLLADVGADGKISLREAILATNGTGNLAAPDEIHFNIPLNDVQHFYYQDDSTADSLTNIVATTLDDASIVDFDPDYPGTPHSWFRISPTSVLPAITDAVIIDGYTQTGAAANTLVVGTDAVMRIELDGTVVGAGDENGLTLQAGDSIVRGLVINRFANDAIEIEIKDGNTIVGNYFGTDVTGTVALGNDFGINVKTADNIIGGTSPAHRNVISGNVNEGVYIYTAGAHSNTVAGNYIGIDATGLAALGNGESGIIIEDGAASNLIGGINPEEGNIIAYNGRDGIAVLDSASGNALRGNSIFSNSDLGINFEGGTEDGFGVTANDTGDADNGPNKLQNYPVLTSVVMTASDTTIAGTINSKAGTTFALDFYYGSAADPSGYGEAMNYLGSGAVTTDGSGDGSFSVVQAFAIPVGSFVTATATDPDGNTSEFSLCHTLTNAAPTVALSNTTTTISEDSDTTLRTRVADITVTDDALGTASLSLAGADAGLFEIQTGLLYLKAGAPLDYETNAQLDVTVQVNDAAVSPDPNDTADLSITVTDANEAPTVALSNTTAGISEAADTTLRTRVADITVTDDALGTASLSLAGADAGLFEIQTGLLYLKAGAPLDYETNAQLDVTVQVNDAAVSPDPNDTADLSITVTDANEAPTVALSNTTAGISEAADTTLRTRVADITVTDDALGTASLSLAGADAGLFEIQTGLLYLKAGAPLDYETNAQLDVTVQVNDAAVSPDPNDTADLSISVTDANEAPTVALSNTTAGISEAADTTLRTRVADITVTDDALGTASLSLAGADAGLFEIQTGLLYLKAGAPLDYETNAQLDVTVQVNDAAVSPDPNDTADLSITVTDANEAPTVALSNTTAGISEAADTTLRTRVADITVTDDALGTASLSLAGADAGLFEIQTGLLYLKAGAPLDYETNAQLDVTVQVNDAAVSPDPNDTAALSITVTDANEAPTVALSNTTAGISEAADTTLRTRVADITVTDDALGTASLSLAGADAGLFEIQTGLLYLKAGAPLDYETNAQLDVTVQVNDAAVSPDPNDTADLSITVTDANEAPTVALSNTTAGISEAADTTLRTRVADITVTDDALGTASLSLAGADAGLFEIQTGLLYLKAGAPLDYETNAQLDVTVQVNDAAVSPDPNDTADLSITVTDANEAPTVALSNTTAGISEAADTTLRTRVADITVTDDALGTASLSLAGADAGLFEIQTGLLYLKAGAPLDYETNAQLDVTVQVNDAAVSPDPNDTADLSITVTDANEAPTVALSNTTAEISEAADTTLRTQVADITVTDDAPGTNALSLAGADAGLFEIDSNVLYLKAGTVLDHETNGRLDVTVEVNDATVSPAPNDTADLSITVTDANDAPVLGNNSLAISEGATVIFDSSMLSATDVDHPDAGLTFTISAVNAGQFERVSTGLAIAAFTQTDIASGDVRFVHDGSQAPPGYSVSVSDGSASAGPTAAAVSFTNVNDPGTLTIDNTTPAQGDTLTAGVADPDGAGGSIAYQWYRDGAAIGEATAAAYTTIQADVGKVMTVTAGYTDDFSSAESLTSGGTAAVTNVNDAPVLGNNNLAISEGATVTLDSSMLSATDVDHPAASLTFNVSGVTAGYFALSGDPATPITSFDQSDITAGNVVFVHDGSQEQPGYSVSVTDGIDSTAAIQANITFTNQNDSPTPGENFLTITENAAGSPESSTPAATDPVNPVPPAASSESGGSAGQLSSSSDAVTSITSMDQGDIAEGTVVFLQDGNKTLAADSTEFRRADFGRVDDNSSSNRTYFTYQRLKLLLGAQNFGELKAALGNSKISTLSSSDYDLVQNSLDAIKAEIGKEIMLGKTVLGSAMAASIGLSAGYVVWLLKGGSLLASVLSSLPAWQLADPLAILVGKKGNDDEDDDESLETIIDDGTKRDENKESQDSELNNVNKESVKQ